MLSASGRPWRRAPGIWDRAVDEIERFRGEQRLSYPADAIGSRPRDLVARVTWGRAQRMLDPARREINRDVGTRRQQG